MSQKKTKKLSMPLTKEEKEYLEDAFINQDEDKRREPVHTYPLRIPKKEWLALKKIAYLNSTTVKSILEKLVAKYVQKELNDKD
jgi:hypothetical protein